MGRFAFRLLALGLILAAGLGFALLTGGRARATTTTVPTTLSTTASTTTTSTAGAVLVLNGHGWGHGLGLSQWGTYGYAKHGWTYDRILAHYYSGTTLGAATVSTVRVLLASERKSTLAATVAWSATDAAGTTVQLAAGPIVVGADLLVGTTQLTSPVTFKSPQPINVDGKAYRGRVVVTSDGKTLQVVDVVGLEAYVKGVVAPEMPPSWPADALKAQAVASRSYVLANLAKGRGYDVYGDSRSQDYGGVAAETPTTSAAVDATRHQIVLYDGKVADTLYSTSSGGRTASAAETTGTAVPYLVSVADPYDTLAPSHNWGPVVVDLARVAKLLKLAAPIVDIQTTPGTSPRVKRLTLLTADESQVTVTGNQLRAALDLKSTWFTPALLDLQKPAKAVTYGGAATLTGFARGIADPVSLESKPAGGAWTPFGDVVLDANGGLATIVHPDVTTQYRLVWGCIHAALAKVSVAPRVDAQAATAAGVQGTTAPVQSGSPVELQQQSGTIWTTIASGVTDDTGAWSFAVQLQAGTYRVRCTPGHGLVAGLSPVLAVP